MVRKLVQKELDGDEIKGTNKKKDRSSEVQSLVSHILFATMMVIVAATCTRRLHEERGHHRMGASEREASNPVALIVRQLIDSMQGRHVALVRELLRMDEVRGVLRHYHSRRDCGTGRTLKLAKGIEV
jgi:hypothetical protein